MRQIGSVIETRSDVLIRGLWESHMEEIIDIRFGDADVETCKPEIMDKILVLWEKNQEKQAREEFILPTETFFSIFPLG